jgi:hypothetical protein
MKSEEFDKKFDKGEEDITSLLDLSKTRRPIIDKEEQELLESFENGEWVRVANPEAEIRRHQDCARNTMEKKCRN